MWFGACLWIRCREAEPRERCPELGEEGLDLVYSVDRTAQIGAFED